MYQINIPGIYKELTDKNMISMQNVLYLGTAGASTYQRHAATARLGRAVVNRQRGQQHSGQADAQHGGKARR